MGCSKFRHTKSLHNLYFLNENLGWACGFEGTILKTTNGGDEWNSHNIGTNDDAHAIFFLDSLVGWAVLYEYIPDRHGSIIHTTDGGISWNVQLSIFGYTLHSIHFSDEDYGWVAGSNGIVYHTTNGGISWLQQYPQTQGGWLWPIFFIDDNLGWTVGDPLFGLFKSTDGGNTWLSYNIPVVERVHSIVFLNSQTGWLCGAQGQIAKSENGGNTWSLQFSSTSEYFRDIYFTDLNTGWCVGQNGTILHTTDGGSDWNIQTSGTLNELRAVQFIDNQIGWAVGENGTILKTTNGGLPVELISFTAKSLNGKVILEWTTASELNNYGFEIERKTENLNWRSVSFVEGKGTTAETQHYSFIDDLFGVNELNINYRLRQIDFDGSFEYSNEVTVKVSQPKEYYLSQNYPNPFNPTTTINYSLAKDGFVSIKVYDILGNEVLTLVNSQQQAGNHNVVFEADNLSSGIYYYQLKSGDFTDIKKLVLIK